MVCTPTPTHSARSRGLLEIDGNMLTRLQLDLPLERPLVEKGNPSLMREAVRSLATSAEVLGGFRGFKGGKEGGSWTVQHEPLQRRKRTTLNTEQNAVHR